MTREHLAAVLRDFGYELASHEPVTSGGSINWTYFVHTTCSEWFVLQRVNTGVFKNVEALHANIAQIEKYLHNQSERTCIPEFVRPPGTDRLFLRVGDGEVWRLQRRVMNVRTCFEDRVATARAVGDAFGGFFGALADMDTNALVETIPRFHDMSLRVEQLHRAVENDVCGRVVECRGLLKLLKWHEASMLSFWQHTLQKMPRRVTHNDTNVDNVLLDATSGVATVIDLDTVMPGLAHSDFGDAIRALFRESARFDDAVFRAFAQAWLSRAASRLTHAECSTLHLAPAFMSYMQCLRFLSDYLCGDVYYHKTRPQQNLLRARQHFELCRDLQLHERDMADAIASFVS
ncbi:MAG: hypothetical protein MHM6MM_005643 [Cercozoa sp. M6MM]